MGEYADMHLDGTLCEGCGVTMRGPGDGSPRRCRDCGPIDASFVHPSTKVACPTCKKRVKLAGVTDHMRDAHPPAKQPAKIEITGSSRLVTEAVRYYREKCSGAEPSISVFLRMLDEALAAQPDPAAPAEPKSTIWPPPATVNRYCRAGMCAQSDDEHETWCVAHKEQAAAAPSVAPEPINWQAAIEHCYKTLGHAQGTKGCIAFAKGAEWMRDQLAAHPPRAPLTDAEIDCLRSLDTDRRVRFYEHDFYVLSNFSAFNLEWEGMTFQTSEAAYHWEKFAIEADDDTRNSVAYAIYEAPSAHEAFKIAETQKHLRRPDWDDVKVGIMRDILRAKADQHEYVRRKLLATGDRELVEDSWRDDFWGWGPNRDGQNMLGKLWMEVRAELRDSVGGISAAAIGADGGRWKA